MPLVYMVVFTEGAADNLFVMTLTEKVVLLAPIYIFIFTNVTTKEVVTFTKTTADDTGAPERYNEFTIDVSTLFANKAAGQWQYEVYESIDGVTRGELLENGKMLLSRPSSISYTGYNTPPTYTGYAG